MVLHFGVEVHDNGGDQGHHDDAVDSQNHGENPGGNRGGGVVPEADGGHHGKAVPKSIPVGCHAGLQNVENIGKGHDQQQEACQDFRGKGLANDFQQHTHLNLGEGHKQDGCKGLENNQDQQKDPGKQFHSGLRGRQKQKGKTQNQQAVKQGENNIPLPPFLKSIENAAAHQIQAEADAGQLQGSQGIAAEKATGTVLSVPFSEACGNAGPCYFLSVARQGLFP